MWNETEEWMNLLTSFLTMYLVSGLICAGLYVVGALRRSPDHLRRHWLSCVLAFLHWPMIFIDTVDARFG